MRGVMEMLQVLSFATTLLLGYTADARVFTPPRIFPEFAEYIISSGDNLTLRCEAKEPVTWTYPDNTEYIDYTEPVTPSTIKVNSSITPDSEYTYGSILTIQNASYLDTGFYYCHGDTTDFEDLYRVSNIYIYIRDPEHLSVLSELPFAVMATQHSEAILPCRVTSPDVQVELFQATGDEALLGKVLLDIPDENGNYVTYDPRKGFIMRQVSAEDGTLYDCHFFRDKVTNNATIILTVQPITFSIAKPYIEEISGGHTVVGEKLLLRCTLKVDVHFIMDWLTPGRNESGRIQLTKTIKESHDTFYRELIIENTTLDDQGEYTCVVKDNNHTNNNTKFVRIFDKSEHFINLTEPNDVYDISVKAGAPSAQWRIDVKAHPLPKLVWYDNRNEEIQSGWSDNKNQKYEVRTQSSSEAFLKINDITIYDRGYYTLKAINEFEEVSLQLFLNVTDKPSVHIAMKSFHLINEVSTVKCMVAAYPDPSVYWFYKKCQNDDCVFESQNPLQTEPQGLLLISYLNISANQSGYVMCTANNSLGSDKSIIGFFVSDVTDGFGIWGLDEETTEYDNGKEQIPIAVGETFTLYCAASRNNYTDDLKWYKADGSDFVPIEHNSHYSIENGNTDFSNKISLTVQDVDYGDSGNYTCQVKKAFNWEAPNSEQFLYESIIINVRDPEKPIIVDSNLNGSDFMGQISHNIELRCFTRGIPKPTVTWYKDGEEWIETAKKSRIQFTNNNQRMVITDSKVEDEGSYVCKAHNRIGSVKRQMALKFTNKPPDVKWYLIGSISIAFLCMVCAGTVYARFRKERHLRRELKRAGLANFENGALESLNPELGIDDQAELLPYDRKWEFPREKMKLGKQLGAGAFGVVMKAEANGIVEGEETTSVAVKMVKRNADYSYIKALASELKIMVHLGKHLNVVNLLGACTKNVVKRELLVIVEYCRFGNLHNYLLRHRNSFINQIDVKTGKIDYTFGAEILERSFSVSSDRSKSHSSNLKYAALSFSHSDNNPLPKDMADYRGNFNYSGETAYTGSTAISMLPTGGEDTFNTSSSSAQPEWRSNYHGDYKGKVKPICTKDLITWAFQVARGMEYLASRKVLHGDLAARNILLAENNIVKICDFGLAKSMYKSDNYKKKGDGPLPVKWMAIESIRDRVFSTQSDVWSYGIVLWEFFSLARTPYPGMEADERLYNKLVDGYRMDSPEYSTKEIYSMMCECWHPKPLYRPSFTNLAKTIGLMLEESVRQHYVDLNDPYLVMNTQRREEGHSDYLAMLSPPDFEHLSSPHNYVNDDVLPNVSPNPTDTAGYLCMKPSHIFSPRENEEGNIFSFDIDANSRKHKNSNGEVALGVELLPMLHTQNESDCETPHLATSPTSFSNPTYHIPPNVMEEKSTEDIVKSADNYVNMPQNKSAMKNDKTDKSVNNSNFSTNTNSNNYVNSSSRDWERIQA